MRPVIGVIGRLSVVLGLSMLLPAALDYADGSDNWRAFALSAFLVAVSGQSLSLASRSATRQGLSRQQALLLTTLVWFALPVFGSVPFVLGSPSASLTDAFFEAMSGLTTTGATVFSGLGEADRGMLLWRALLQWFGGVGIVVVAMVFLPVLKIGGMQFFRSEGFDVSGDILPRAAEVARALFWIYLTLTVLCVIGYASTGMTTFEAVAHAMTTVSTGGMGTYDDSFDRFSSASHYVAVVFMALAALPFIRLIQLSRGQWLPLWRDSQVLAFLAILGVVTTVIAAWIWTAERYGAAEAVREALFNVTSIMTGTGYASSNYNAWGGFAVTLFFIVALIGGCAGSTSCSAKVFRYQILFAALTNEIRRIHNPSGVFPLRYDRRSVEPEVLSSVMAFFFVFVAAIVIWAVALSMFGLSAITSISGAVAVLANVGPGLGSEIGPAGNFASLPDGAKWLLAFGMVLGRLEFLSVLVLLTPVFWRR
ncbi:MAG: TrkH family potassium uptake protein [Pseudomonadota bacterium]